MDEMRKFFALKSKDGDTEQWREVRLSEIKEGDTFQVDVLDYGIVYKAASNSYINENGVYEIEYDVYYTEEDE